MRSDPNFILAWIWMLLGFVAGMVLGIFFQNENWLGGYSSFRRRMVRLGHISFFGLGAVNLMFAFSRHMVLPAGALLDFASKAFLIGGITMPVCCAVLALCPKARAIFAIPILNLITGGVLVLIDLARL